MKFTLFIPTKNEIDAVKVIMPQIRPEWVDEIICVDGHSTDGTPQWLEEHGYRVIPQQSDGLIGAYWECMDVAQGDVIVAFSPDGNSMVDAIPQLIEKIKEGYDIVVASRYAPGSHSDDDDWLTGFGNWFFTGLSNVLYGAHNTDLLVMYRAFRKSLPYDLELSRSRHPMMEIELMLRGVKNGLRMTDIPAVEPARIGGVRKMKIFYNGWFVLWVIIKELFVHRRMKTPPPPTAAEPGDKDTPASADAIDIAKRIADDGSFLRRPGVIAGLMVFLSCTLSLLAAAQTSPWKLDLRLDNDTARYYDTQNFEVHNPGDFFRALADPFFRAPDAGAIEAPAGKPVFVDILRVWGMAARCVFGHDAWVTRSAYFKFLVFAFGLLALTICAMGWRIGSPYLGMLAAVVALLNPWAMVQLVYRNYTCIGMALFLSACLLALRRNRSCIFLAGVVAWMAFLTDNGILLYSAMLGAVVIAGEWGDWRRMVDRGLLFAAGIVSPYILLSLVGMIWYPGYSRPLSVTIDYFTHFATANHFATRPGADPHATVPKYPAIALLFIRENSWIVFGLILVVVPVAFWQCARVGVSAAAKHSALGPIIALLLPVFLVWTAIDLKPGAQLAHTYFVGYPLVVLALAIFWWRWANRGPVLHAAWALLAVLYVIETGMGLYRYRTVFFSLQNTVAAATTSSGHEKLAILYNDPHAKIIQHLLSPEYADRIVLVLNLQDIANFAAGAQINTLIQTGPGLLQYRAQKLEKGDYISHVLCGPLGETIVFCPPVPVWADDPQHGQREIVSGPGSLTSSVGYSHVSFSDPVKIPFYGLYPLLIFDDEWPTWQYIERNINDDSCMNDPGIIRMSTVSYPDGMPNGASK